LHHCSRYERSSRETNDAATIRQFRIEAIGIVMNPKLARLLTRIYPRFWRKRYGAEFEELLETERGGIRTATNIIFSGLREHIFPIRGLATDLETGSGRFNLLCARVPWVVFSVTPISLLAGCYIAAWLILWTGWTIFLPGRDTPFGGPQHGLANLYFQFGKYFYASAPILVGWVVAVLAVRQRAKAVWLLPGLVLVAWIGAAARIRASRTEIPGGLGHIRMNFVLWPWVQNGHDGLVHALVILSLTVLPYLFWRIKTARTTLS
jgi:hypothetical protein